MNLFIDTNILLNFYHFSKDSLEELEKVFVLQNYGKISLWLTDQVDLELSRNREAKIADALKRFLDEKPSSGIPHIARGYPECEQLMNALKAVNTSRDRLLDKVKNDINSKTLYADTLINEIFKKSTRIPLTDSQFTSSKRRSDLRSPPGKNGSLGDAINWEALLEAIPDGQGIFIISEDGDFSSPLDNERLSDFLSEEWARRKKSIAILHKRVSQFLSINFPDARVAAELEKDILIVELANSGNFAKTHQVIEALTKFTSFNSKQASDIADAFIMNPQVAWIVTDEDVKSFGNRILTDHNSTLDHNQAKAFISLLST
ncbi:MAG: PIN domain-containing protein [Fluviicoccus sp.]|uniref:PIN domain-containing protein n=1 Tax=Fluviicoccus sp. TaxID=2003552 RepID=UPI00271A24AD|nr:PIN domain-containing protein [Fluviicoccus sp.]MDO8329019.1 PIN domain-containing protein [Fluviicoccus sp.]